MFKNLKSFLNDREIGIISEGPIRHYSVLVPLVVQDDEIYILFERRSQNITQSNDICFPGGRVEQNESYEFASIRETSEELLVDKHQVEILGPLDLYMAHDRLIVHPFLGVVHNYQNTYSQDEVAQTHLVKLSELLAHQPESYGGKFTLQLDDDFPYSKIEGGRSYPWRQAAHKILFYTMKELTIWGMTAQILRAALNVLKECD